VGAGLPAAPATYQIARAVNPAATAAYVDTDPVVLSHARALLAVSDQVGAVAADLRAPPGLLSEPGLGAVIGPARPIGVILGAVLHFLDPDAARRVTRGYRTADSPGQLPDHLGGLLDDEALAKRLAAEYTAGTFVNHDLAGIHSFLAGLEPVGPGLAEAGTWRARMPAPVPRRREGHVLAGVARRESCRWSLT